MRLFRIKGVVVALSALGALALCIRSVAAQSPPSAAGRMIT